MHARESKPTISSFDMPRKSGQKSRTPGCHLEKSINDKYNSQKWLVWTVDSWSNASNTLD